MSDKWSVISCGRNCAERSFFLYRAKRRNNWRILRSVAEKFLPELITYHLSLITYYSALTLHRRAFAKPESLPTSYLLLPTLKKSPFFSFLIDKLLQFLRSLHTFVMCCWKLEGYLWTFPHYPQGYPQFSSKKALICLDFATKPGMKQVCNKVIHKNWRGKLWISLLRNC